MSATEHSWSGEREKSRKKRRLALHSAGCVEPEGTGSTTLRSSDRSHLRKFVANFAAAQLHQKGRLLAAIGMAAIRGFDARVSSLFS
jgi:hypothetical protein